MSMRSKAGFLSLAYVVVASAVFAGNEANPDAIELAPLPLPVEFKSDMDRLLETMRKVA